MRIMELSNQMMREHSVRNVIELEHLFRLKLTKVYSIRQSPIK
jgi:hypothetical protein